MTEITDLNPTDASNTALTGNGIQGTNFVSNFDNAMRSLLGLLGRLNSGAAPIADTFTIADPVDLTKRFRFDGGLITAGQTRVITVPDGNITLGGGTAGDITFTPAGNIAATDVQAAIQELDTEKQPLDSDLTSWAGVARASGFDTFVATPSSVNLKALLTDETGSGAAVFADTPTLVTPVLGAATGTSLVLSGLATASAFVPSSSSVPTNGMYLPNTDNLGWAVGGAHELTLTSARLAPAANDGLVLGSATSSFSDLFLASGGIVNWNNGNFTLTHSSGVLTASGNIAVADDAYAVGWNGSANVPTKNAVYDKIELVLGTTLPATYQPLLATLTSWGAVTRAAGFDTFTATPSSANLRSLLTDEDGTGPALFGGSSYIREKLTADRTYYVRTDGSDSNTGLVDSSGGAFLTKAAALAAAARLDCSTYDVTIQVRDGTFTGAAALPLMIGSGTFTLIGNTTTPANCIISRTSADAISAVDCGAWTVRGFKLQTTTGGNGISAQGRTTIRFNTIDFGTVAGAHHIYAAFGANVLITGNYSITGASAYAHMTAAFGGYIQNYSTTVTLTGTPAFSIFALATGAAKIDSGSVTYSGSATGQRYLIEKLSFCETNGGGINYFPGNSAGNCQSGGVYA